MGQSGLMMGGGPAVAFAAPDPLSVALLVPVPVFGLVAFELWWHVGRPVPPRGTPGDVLRARCAQGEINARLYHDALIGVLKDRYVRGEIEIDEFEEKVAWLVRGEQRGAPPADTPLATGAPRSVGDERGFEQ